MKNFDYATAINQLKVGKDKVLNEIKYQFIPEWVQGEDFLNLFLPYLKIIGDSREQDRWVEKACDFYGIAFEWAKKDDKLGTENLKEGDYTYQVIFGEKTYDYLGEVAYERKGSVAEFYGNCTGYHKNTKTSDRDRIKREFERFKDKGYKKVVLLLEFGENMYDLMDLEFSFRGNGGVWQTKNTGNVIYSTVMSWKQPNGKNFNVIQSKSHEKLFWQMIQDCYYYFRNEICKECYEKGLIEKEKGGYERC